jgi:hypothetical protein
MIPVGRLRREVEIEYRIEWMAEAEAALPHEWYQRYDGWRALAEHWLEAEAQGISQEYTLTVDVYARETFPTDTVRWAWEARPVTEGDHPVGCRHTVLAPDVQLAQILAIDAHRRCVGVK